MQKTISTFYKALFSVALAGLFLTTSCKKTEPDRDKFIGVFRSVSDNCRTTTYQLTVTVSSQADNKIILTNLNNVSSLALTATVSGTSFTIEQSTQNNQTISGNGSLSGNVLTINYSVQGTTSFTCAASFNKQ
jgi:hypothetical protein